MTIEDTAAHSRPAGHADVPRQRGLRAAGPPCRDRPGSATRPVLWLEIALIGVSYWLYGLTRLAAPTHKVSADDHGFQVLNLEHLLGLDVEYAVNHAADKVTWLIVGMNYYYATLHFVVPVAVLAWVYLKFPDRYRRVRTLLFAITALGLVGFYLYPLCPPRFLPGMGYIDTFDTHNTWGTAASAGVAGLPSSSTNPFAAMPSLHVGWSVWCALTICRLAERRWVRTLAVLYPCATFVVIVATANHYVLDAVGGLVAVGGGLVVRRLIYGRSAGVPAGDAAGDPTGVPAGEPTRDPAGPPAGHTAY